MKPTSNRDTYRDKKLTPARHFVPIVKRKAVAPLTAHAIGAMRPGDKRTDGWLRSGYGRLIVRARKRAGSTVREFAFRWHDADGEHLLTLGTLPSLSLKAARARAQELARVREDGGDPRVHVEREQIEQERRDAEKRESGTFDDLLDAYVQSLDGKSSARDVEDTIERHVRNPFARLMQRKASDITTRDLVAIIARVINAGSERKSNMVRAYLHAAFAKALKSDNNPLHAAQHRSLFRLTANPVANIPRQKDFDRVGDRVLTDDELRAYWRALDARSDPIAAALKCALLLGGQRMTQLLRVTWDDYDEIAGTLRLRDPKGRGGARDHLLPVSTRVAALIPALHPDGGPYIFTTGHGVPIHNTTLSSEVLAIAATIVKRGESFSGRDLRRTVETRMSKLGVSKDIRAQVLSHGLTRDIQSKHYDRNAYLPEKTAALAKWEQHIDEVNTDPSPPQSEQPKPMRLRLVANRK